MHTQIDGTLLFADVSGFTALTERLAAKGRSGAEELANTLSDVFTALLTTPAATTGELLSFGGDAILVAFTGIEHGRRASRAAAEMRDVLRSVGGVARLQISTGLHSGAIDVIELAAGTVVVGPSVDQVLAAEALAAPGEIVADGDVVRRRPRLTAAPAGIPRITPRLSSIDGPESTHRVVTAAFFGIEGVADAMASGPDGAAAALDKTVGIIAAALAEREVTVLGTDVSPDGLKVIAVGGAPVAGADHEERMLRACRAVLDATLPLPVRIGVHRGAAFAGPVRCGDQTIYTLIGDTMNTAARLMAQATPFEILATRSVLDRPGTRFETGPAVTFHAKGKAEPVVAHAVGPAMGRRPSTSDGVPFVGRQQELHRLHAARAEAEQGRGAAIEIRGESGIGKSRLVDEFTDTAGADVLRAYSNPYAETSPFDLVRQLLGGVVDETIENADRELDSAVRRDRIETALATALVTPATRPRIVVVEDVDWADAFSAGVLRQATQLVGAHRTVICLTGQPTDEPLTEDVLRLGRLAGEDIAELARQSRGDAGLTPRHEAAIVDRASGSPLVAIELARADADQLPDSVEGLIAGKLDELPAPERQLVRVASVFGATVDAAVLRVVTAEEGIDATPETVRDFLRVIDQARLGFVSALYRDAAYAGLPFADRRRIHTRVLEFAIAEMSSDQTAFSADVVSVHAMEAGRWADAYEWSIKAADVAEDGAALDDMAAALRRALAAAERLPAVSRTERAGLLTRLAVTTSEAERLHEAVLTARRGLRLDPSDDARFELMSVMVDSTHRLGDRRNARRWALRAVAATEGIDSAAAAGLRAIALAALTLLDVTAGRPLATAHLEQLEAEVRRGGSLAATARLLAIRQLVNNRIGNFSVAAGLEAISIYRRLGNVIAEGLTANNTANAAAAARDYPQATLLYQQASKALLAVGYDYAAAMADANAADGECMRGRPEIAIAPMERALAACRAVDGEEHSGAAGLLAVALARAGRADDHARALAREALRVAEARSNRFVIGDALMACAEVSVFAGDSDGAAGFLDDRRLRKAPPVEAMRASALRSWVAVQRDDGLAAGAGFESLLADATAAGDPFFQATAHDGLAFLADRDGDTGAARAHAEQVRALCESMGVERIIRPPIGSPDAQSG